MSAGLHEGGAALGVEPGARTHKPLTTHSAEPVTEQLDRAFAVALLLAESASLDQATTHAAAVVVDLISAARQALCELVAEDLA